MKVAVGDMNKSQAANCPFCSVEVEKTMVSEFAFVIRDSYPVSINHSLVIPKRHVKSIFDLGAAEQAEIWRMVAEVRNELISLGADAVNIGVNDGAKAGQTIDHAHVHVIPRYNGDAEDPRGGVRWVLPTKAAYWI